MAPTTRLMPDPVRHLLYHLRIEAERTNELPTVAVEAVPLARDWLADVLVDQDKREEHFALLRELFRMPTERETITPHRWPFLRWKAMPVDQVEALAQKGPDALPVDQELSRLLLDPFVLHSLAELVGETMADGWLDRMAAAGAEMVARHDLEINVPEPAQLERRQVLGAGIGTRAPGAARWEGGVLVVDFTAESRAIKQRIAEALYGATNRDFALRLHRRRSNGGEFVVELEVSPAPVRGDLTLTVSINGYERSFTLAVPVEVQLDPEAEPPGSVFARAAEPVPAEAFELQCEADWPEGWPPHLVLRCRRGEASGNTALSLADRWLRRMWWEMI